MKLEHKFVDFIPSHIQEGVLYISLEYGSVIHKCACGCGSEVNTPLGPENWKMLFDGESITLKPSIGNWSFDCKSHYWITKNKIKWAEKWDDEKISFIRKKDDSDLRKLYKNRAESKTKIILSKPKLNWYQKLFLWLKKIFK